MKYLNIEIDLARDSQLDENAIHMVMSFYAIKGETSPQQAYARACTAWSTFHGVTDYAMAQRLYDAISNRMFMWSSPALSNAPTPTFTSKGLPISCFLGYVPDTIPGLIDHSSELRYLSVMGGGVGGHWSDVRTVSNLAPGPIPFIHTVDADMTAYKQGDTRKGSYAAYMRVDHPDILEFIGIRVPTGDNNRKAFNIHNAVNITDGFMAAVFAGMSYELVDSKTGPTGTFLDARSVYAKIMETRFRTGEPYLNYIDTANRGLNRAQRRKGLKIHGSNLCNEIHLATNELRTAVCCLSSPNAELRDSWPSTLIRDLTRALDNVLEYFIENAPPVLWKAVNSAKAERSIGIGCMGFHSYLQMHGIPFASEKARVANMEIFSYIKSEFVKESQLLAIERGEPEDLVGTGMRNAHGLAVAPNASSADILTTSPSIEPWKANGFAKRTRGGTTLVVNKFLKRHLASIGRDTEEVWQDIILKGGSVQHLEWLDSDTKAVYETFFEIDQVWVIRHAADRQQYICQGQSVNIAFKPGTPRKKVRQVHDMAFKEGLKGLYYLRSESKQKAETVGAQAVEDKLKDNTNTVIFGRAGCNFCELAKKLMDSYEIEYEYVDIEELGKTAAEVTGRPDVRSVPQIYIEGVYIGGYQETYAYLQEQDDDTKSESEEQDDAGCRACEG
jgi:ribonucleoside-diphosphate reductase alpha chain